MSRHYSLWHIIRTKGCLAAALVLLGGSSPAQAPRQTAGVPPAGQQEFFIHAFHATQLSLDCETCHVPAKEGSVELARPGHDQCTSCHQEAFSADLNQKICSQCHSTFPPSSNQDLLPYPLFKKTRAILFDFSHARHTDPRARNDPKTGFRTDCTFCHKFDEKGILASFPRHAECTACHSKPGVTPVLSAASTTADCRGCHTPEEIENPGFTKERKMIADHVISGVHVNLKFSHIAHFRHKDRYNLNCTTCHYSIPGSTSLADLRLPLMIDCVECHDVSKDLAEEFRMSNCQACHIEPGQSTAASQGSPTAQLVRDVFAAELGGVLPASHTRNVRPDFHTESFRLRHEEESKAPGAKCFVCHLNVEASPQEPANQCLACHLVMRPASHTSRWKDDIHGKYAALDRASCSQCHTADTCVRCHNLLPRTHVPLGQFVGSGHARLAMLDQRACMTCHTFENTCAECHVRQVRSIP